MSVVEIRPAGAQVRAVRFSEELSELSAMRNMTLGELFRNEHLGEYHTRMLAEFENMKVHSFVSRHVCGTPWAVFDLFCQIGTSGKRLSILASLYRLAQEPQDVTVQH